ncbi:DEKNAAC100678 [Brettanomyces naardenensis]|uniref:DEKNAAC100678 n=1 Tax=Brettanomyces naardenensis TaxID=13370 RepID=A0A448YEL8_BRENA|nr:DEKNAAC100678 [Brettanomyces naardenensis]
MDLYVSLPSSNCNYDLRLLTLNDEILETVRNGKERLYIKATSERKGCPVVCTDSKTFKIRQQNQSNCVMLLNVDDSTGLSFDRFSSRLILEDTSPEVPVAKLAKITDMDQFTSLQVKDDGYTLEKLFEDSAASRLEFDNLVPSRQIIEYRGSCYTVDDKLVTACLEKMLELLIKRGIDSGNELEIMKKLEEIDVGWEEWSCLNIPEELVNLCIAKFIESGKLEHDLVVRQFGLEVLKKHRDLKMDDFLINLKLRLPFNYSPEIDLKRSMRGAFFTYKDDTMISYLDESLLSEEPPRRFQQLFALKQQWEVDEIEPFVDRINKHGLKIEKFLLKYCKVRRMGRRQLVGRR